MSKRPRMLSFPAPKVVSDASKLEWKEEWQGIVAAHANLQAVLVQQEQRVVQRMADRDGVDTAKFLLNLNTWKWEPKP